jgi:hypothetical protein
VYSLLEFILHPTRVPRGAQKLTAYIRNASDFVVRNVVVTLHSLNEKALSVKPCEKFIHALMPGEEVSAEFDVLAASDAKVYISLSGFKNADIFFRLNSSTHRINVDKTASVVLLN